MQSVAHVNTTGGALLHKNNKDEYYESVGLSIYQKKQTMAAKQKYKQKCT